MWSFRYLTNVIRSMSQDPNKKEEGQRTHFDN